MPGLFKFLHSADLPRVLENETIRICSASYYRSEFEAMEEGARDPTINDPLEGLVHQVQELGCAGPGQQRLLRTMGMNVSPDSALHYAVGSRGNAIVEQTNDFHMFCLAAHTLDELVPEFCTRHAYRPGAPVYDACVELLDEHALAELLYSPATQILNLQGRGHNIPLGLVFPRLALSPVEYRQNVVTFADEAPDPSPFLKRPELAWQHEFRFAFDPANVDDIAKCRAQTGFPGAAPDPAMIVHVPGLSSLMRPIDIRPYF